MRKLFFTALIFASASRIAIAQERVVEPTPLESFVTRASVALQIDEPVGPIASSEAKLEGALLVTESARSSRRRNLRARLRADSVTGSAVQVRLCLDETQIAAASEDLAGIEASIPELEAETGATWRVQGTGSCWRPARPLRILCPSYGVGPDGSGLWVSAYGGTSFSIPGHRPAELALLLRKAAAALGAL